MTSGIDAYRLATRVRDRAFATVARRSFAAWGRGTVVRLPVRVKGEGRISLGERVFVGEGSWLQTLGEGRITIGDGCQFSGYAEVSAAVSIVLEDDVLLARNVHLLDHGHRFEDPDIPIRAQGLDRVRPIHIGRGSWIGANVVILPGVTVGRQAVIGANSVVRRDVPDFAVVAGAPAEVLRRRDRAQTNGRVGMPRLG